MGNAPKKTFLKERLTNGKQVPGSMFNTNHHQEIISQTHTELSLPLIRIDINKQKRQDEELNKEGEWRGKLRSRGCWFELSFL